MIESNATIELKFERFFKGSKNFITPYPVKYGSFHNSQGQFIYEVSVGSKMLDTYPVGFTVLKYNSVNDVKTTHDLEYNKSFGHKGAQLETRHWNKGGYTENIDDPVFKPVWEYLETLKKL